jgi:hypothetical protein
MQRLTVMAMRARSGAQVRTPVPRVVARVRQPAAMTEVLWALMVDNVRAVVMMVVQARQVIVSVVGPSLTQ